MQRPDEETLNAIVALEGDNRWEKVRQWIKDSHNQIMKELAMMTVFNAGRVAELWDLNNKIDTARKELNLHKR